MDHGAVVNAVVIVIGSHVPFGFVLVVTSSSQGIGVGHGGNVLVVPQGAGTKMGSPVVVKERDVGVPGKRTVIVEADGHGLEEGGIADKAVGWCRHGVV